MSESNEPTTTDPQRKRKIPLPQWFHITRLTGLVMIVYGLVDAQTPERGTLILTGAGLLGFDKVARGGGPGEPPAPA